MKPEIGAVDQVTNESTLEQSSFPIARGDPLCVNYVVCPVIFESYTVSTLEN